MELNIELEATRGNSTVRSRVSVPIPGDVNDQATLTNFTNQIHHLTSHNTASAAWHLNDGAVYAQDAVNIGARGAAAPQGLISLKIVSTRQVPYQRLNLTVHRDHTFRGIKEALGFDVNEWDGWVDMGAWTWLTDHLTLAQMYVPNGTVVYLCARRDRDALRRCLVISDAAAAAAGAALPR